MLEELFDRLRMRMYRHERADLISDQAAAALIEQLRTLPPEDAFLIVLTSGDPYLAELKRYGKRLQAILKQAGWKPGQMIIELSDQRRKNTLLITGREAAAVTALQAWLNDVGEPTTVKVDNSKAALQISIYKA